MNILLLLSVCPWFLIAAPLALQEYSEGNESLSSQSQVESIISKDDHLDVDADERSNAYLFAQFKDKYGCDPTREIYCVLLSRCMDLSLPERCPRSNQRW